MELLCSLHWNEKRRNKQQRSFNNRHMYLTWKKERISPRIQNHEGRRKSILVIPIVVNTFSKVYDSCDETQCETGGTRRPHCASPNLAGIISHNSWAGRGTWSLQQRTVSVGEHVGRVIRSVWSLMNETEDGAIVLSKPRIENVFILWNDGSTCRWLN